MDAVFIHSDEGLPSRGHALLNKIKDENPPKYQKRTHPQYAHLVEDEIQFS